MENRSNARAFCVRALVLFGMVLPFLALLRRYMRKIRLRNVWNSLKSQRLGNLHSSSTSTSFSLERPRRKAVSLRQNVLFASVLN